MRPLSELIANEADDAWGQVAAWIAASQRPVEILGCDRADGEATLLSAQVTTRSPRGAVAYHCAGITIDGGWLRFLGAGSDQIGGLRAWNEGLGGAPLEPPVGDALLVACDALGGWFAINGGRWPDRHGGIRYLTPDATGWQALDLRYSELLQWALSDAVDQFYEGQRWPGWEGEVAALGADRAVSMYPPLGFETTPIADRSRRAVPLRELWTFHHEMAGQAADLEDGSQVEFRLGD